MPLTPVHRIVPVLAVVCVATVGSRFAYHYFVDDPDRDKPIPAVAEQTSVSASATAAGDAGASPAGQLLRDQNSPTPRQIIEPTATKDIAGVDAPLAATEAPSFDTPAWQAAGEAGGPGWSDAAFQQALSRLRTDSAFREAIEQELWQEENAGRIRRLSQLLGALGERDVTDLAEALLYSGTPATRFGAMDLLRRQQPIDPRARDMALRLMSASSDERELVAAMNILATPGVALPAQQTAIVSQLTTLTDHPAASVRRQSYSILGRWIEDQSAASVMAAGLEDPERAVRESVAYALVDYPFNDPLLKQRLWSIVGSEIRHRSEREAALLAYESMPLNDSERQQAQSMRDQWQRRR